MITKFIKGAFNLQPTKATYHTLWDVNILLHEKQNVNKDSDMKEKQKYFLYIYTHFYMYRTDTECIQ